MIAPPPPACTATAAPSVLTKRPSEQSFGSYESERSASSASAPESTAMAAVRSVWYMLALQR